MFTTARTTMIMKTEATPYTAETLADADFNIEVQNLEYGYEIKEFQQAVMDGTLDQYCSVMGKQSGSCSFMIPMVPGAAVNTVPAWGKALQSCGYVQTAFGATGISWVPSKFSSHIPMTIEFQEINHGASPSILVTRLGGCMGEVSFLINEVGEPVQMVFSDVKGSLLLVEDRPFGSLLDPTSPTAICAPAVLASAMTIGGINQVFEKFEIKTGNPIALWTDSSLASGIKGAYISGKRETMLTLDPLSDLLANDAVYTQFKAGTTGALAITVDDGSNPAITISAPKCQYSTVNVGAERDGARVNEKAFRLLKSATAGNDSLEILQGAKA